MYFSKPEMKSVQNKNKQSKPLQRKCNEMFAKNIFSSNFSEHKNCKSNADFAYLRAPNILFC